MSLGSRWNHANYWNSNTLIYRVAISHKVRPREIYSKQSKEIIKWKHLRWETKRQVQEDNLLGIFPL